ncbi:MAG: 16S rRNA (guanine1207-N2)-methyltransferase [Acidimicrobiales bacterium]|jgi:16S rRNA (guanine1207-N2)-methyltransferase
MPQGRRAASPDTLHIVTESHYFDGDPSVKSNVRQVPLHLSDLSVELDVDRGVFSSTKVDEGTQVLLVEAARPGAAKAILDVGCGYGPIACAVAKRAPSAKVWAVDVNSRARDLCASNAKRLGLDISVHAPEDMPADQRFDLIVSNPPIRIGKKNLHPLLELWLDRLTPDGHAELVVHKHLGSDSLQRWLTEQGWTTTRLISRSGYRVLIVQPRDANAHPSEEQAGPT